MADLGWKAVWARQVAASSVSPTLTFHAVTACFGRRGVSVKIAVWMLGITSSLLGGAAHAAEPPYAEVGGWEITTEAGVQRCYMERFYRSNAGTTEGLSVVFDAKEDQTLLFWSTSSKIFPLAEGKLDLDLRLRDGDLIDDGWGSQTFHYETVADMHIFRLAFLDRETSGQILADLARYPEIGLFLGPVLQAAFPLTPAAVEKLTECVGRRL